jgi:uncharacterized protein YcnI
MSEGVTEIAWTGGELPDEWYDEFVFRGGSPTSRPGRSCYFPVVQECPDGAVHRWIEIPEPARAPTTTRSPPLG